MQTKIEKFIELEQELAQQKFLICLDISEQIRKLGDKKFAELIGIPISSAIKYRLGTPPHTELMKEIVGKIK